VAAVVVLVVVGGSMAGAVGADDAPVNTEPDTRCALVGVEADDDRIDMVVVVVAGVEVVVVVVVVEESAPCVRWPPGERWSADCAVVAALRPRPLPPPEIATRSAMSARDTARTTHQLGFPRAVGVAVAAP
jgi:hypothetical protein